MKKLSIRLVSLLLSISLLLPALTLPVFAAYGQGIGADAFLDTESVTAWEYELGISPGLIDVLQAFAYAFGVDYSTSSVWWATIDGLSSCGFVYGEVSFDELQRFCDQLNSIYGFSWQQSPYGTLVSAVHAIKEGVWATFFGIGAGNCRFEIRPFGTSGFFRIYEKTKGIWFVNSDGQYPCASYAQGGEEVRGRHWRPASEASSHVVQKKPVNMQSNHSLALINEMIIQTGIDSQIRTIANKYNAIWYDYQYYCDADGYPFVAPMEEDQWGVNQDRVDTEVRDENGDPAVDEDGEVIEENNEGNSTNIDFSGMTITLPTGDLILADSVLYDESTKTYQIDARQYVEEGDTYIYNTYEYTYHVNYTSITYIGQTEEYNKYYEVYYELPDGRSSADLTKEELEQLNVSMDIIPYGRSADDTSLRSLYHFDGDIKDSSYWNYCTNSVWWSGASLTYVDSGVFGGALYLDETFHNLGFVLPSDIGVGDFTVQFRYYQSHTVAPYLDTYFSLALGSDWFSFVTCDGSALCTSAGEYITTLPVGSWNEIAVVRSHGILSLYLNGLPIYSYGGNYSVFGNTVAMYFGAEQQTYKYLDELRVLNYAIADAGVAYTPTSVPHDTNLTLVLPDTVVPVADEYWQFDTTIDPLMTWDFTGYNGSPYQYLPDVPEFENPLDQNPYYFSATSYTPVTQYDGFLLVEGVNSNWATGPRLGNVYEYDNISLPWSYRYRAGFSALLFAPYVGTSMSGYGFYQVGRGVCSSFLEDIVGRTYTFSVVLSSGRIDSLTFTVPPSASLHSIVASSSFDWGQLMFTTCETGFSSSHLYLPYMATILPYTGSSVSIVYAEIVEGAAANTGHKFVTGVSVIDKDDIGKFTLAVRTDLTITSHQIGGARPSTPTKGLVWALVEGGFIRSLQIYNGSAWEAVDGRVWTGSRWVSVSSYNVITLQDMHDISDATSDYEYIYTETGFWSWWQKTWNNFVTNLDKKLDQIIQALGGSTADGDITEPDASGNSKFTLLQFFGNLFTGVQEIASDVVGGALDGLLELGSHFVQSISDFFAGFAVMDIMSSDYFEGLGDTLGEASDLVGGVWDAVPEEVQKPLVGGFMLTAFGVLMRVV